MFKLERKAQLLVKTFFPTLLTLDLSDIQGYQYPEPVPYEEIKEKEIESAIGHASEGKAPRPDAIPNEILK